MPFIPHTPEDIRGMLDAIGVGSIDALFDVPPPGTPKPKAAEGGDEAKPAEE